MGLPPRCLREQNYWDLPKCSSVFFGALATASGNHTIKLHRASSSVALTSRVCRSIPFCVTCYVAHTRPFASGLGKLAGKPCLHCCLKRFVLQPAGSCGSSGDFDRPFFADTRRPQHPKFRTLELHSTISPTCRYIRQGDAEVLQYSKREALRAPRLESVAVPFNQKSCRNALNVRICLMTRSLTTLQALWRVFIWTEQGFSGSAMVSRVTRLQRCPWPKSLRCRCPWHLSLAYSRLRA